MSDRTGSANPKIVMSALVHDGPAPHGSIAFGMIP
jgi:hypothetical protein